MVVNALCAQPQAIGDDGRVDDSVRVTVAGVEVDGRIEAVEPSTLRMALAVVLALQLRNAVRRATHPALLAANGSTPSMDYTPFPQSQLQLAHPM
jgi:hypothetical protein